MVKVSGAKSEGEENITICAVAQRKQGCQTITRKINAIACCLLFSVALAGCGNPSSASRHKAAVQDNSTDRLTVGKVQKEIRVGMSSAEVASVLGSPNIVSTDEARREVWIYDKIATETAYSTSSGGTNVLILGWDPTSFGGIGAGSSGSSGAASKTQRTLTVIIKYDKAGKVRDFAYHTSRF